MPAIFSLEHACRSSLLGEGQINPARADQEQKHDTAAPGLQHSIASRTNHQTDHESTAGVFLPPGQRPGNAFFRRQPPLSCSRFPSLTSSLCATHISGMTSNLK